ncbi:restriction endonuclease [Robiginitalea sp. M366]|uniref:ATP cone domain-containing protein n=1 Tax=Robiginitalea aestuariiviva TaxID=3036903 RepID=UPI00240DAACE|nr:ATP cone domain-containing protein [Robiginitalea aestuariiviva]MDG1572449.1 restriction endonuclease [Robiginitalea aestuariiviva]
MSGKKGRKPAIRKSSGDEAPFSETKLRRSLSHSGAEASVVDAIVRKVAGEVYPGMSTREIHNRAFALLREHRSSYASRYKLKRAIYELGPTGFPFEKFIAALLNHSGYQAETNVVFRGGCVSHEVDVVARNGHSVTPIECKFHADEGRKCTVKIPLYIHSRFRDMAAAHPEGTRLKPGWVVTNTRFTADALAYGKCAGLYLLSWNHPRRASLKDRIDRHRLYPITVSMLLSSREKAFLLEREIVLGRELLKAPYFLDHLGVSRERKARILEEFSELCQQTVAP